jgi:hypothetical protein
MAGEWIKVENTTPDKPEVFVIAEELQIDPDAVIGKLIRIWVWADEQTTNGNAVSVTRALLDRLAGVTGFAVAMEKAGWLRREERGLEFPNFEYHNGQTAKKRGLTAKRVASHRRKSNAGGNAVSVTSALPREEKRREEDKNPPTPHGGDSAEGKSKRKKKTTGEAVPIPEHLDSPEFRVAWGEWLQDRSVRGKPVTEIAAKKQFADLLPHGPAKSIEIIRVSIKNGWTGLFPEKVSMPSVPTPNAVPPRLIHNVADLSKPNTLPPLYPVKQTVGT